MSWNTWMTIATAILIAATADADGPALDEALCRTCEVRGAAHGAEKVVASREFEGTTYHFCSEPCTEAFDGFPSGYAIHPVPRPAPRVTVTTTEGRPINLGQPGGGPTLVDFWATWCAPCIEAMPELAELQREHEDAGLRVLGLSIDEDAEDVEKFLRRNTPGYRIAMDSRTQPAWLAYDVAAIPSMVLIDGEGEIVEEWQGQIDFEDVRSSVEALLTSKGDD